MMKGNLDRLALGTVQFGMDYGVNNPAGKPSNSKTMAMLDYAWQKGIRIFDTAYAYGSAEKILGEFARTRNLKNDIRIITKLKPNILDEKSGKTVDIIENNLKESLERLNVKQVDGFLLHTPSYIYNDKVVDALVDLRKKGLTKNIGVSIYEAKDAIYAARLGKIDFIQVPYSIFDQRLEKTFFFETAKRNNVTVFSRTAFLQGLFFMSKNKIPAYLQIVKPYFNKLDRIINKYNMSRQQAALLFSYRNKFIDHVVIGVDTLDQLKEDIAIAEENIDCDSCIKELKENFANVKRSIIFPSLWKNKVSK